MKGSVHNGILILVSCLMLSACRPSNDTNAPKNEGMKKHYTSIALHGGAGNLKKMNLTEAEEKEYLLALDQALAIGDSILLSGGTSQDAVVAVITFMEDCPLFNAGKGSVFNHEGINEMDAAIMHGASLKCGAVAGVRHVKNPIKAAWTVMQESEHILLTGQGAESFVQAHGVELVDSSYFFVAKRWEQWQEALKDDKTQLDHDGAKPKTSSLASPDVDQKFGTVGCVALDKYGNLCAGTSTGGLTNKKYGRIGDSPIIGAGTYANNASCAVSCTGKGEDFIRGNIASDISARVLYLHEDIELATKEVIQTKLKSLNGRGGCIAVDAFGNVAVEFTTSGMFRAFRDGSGRRAVQIYRQ
jgi:L-asparaginase / beta-aspartyl-peptidase